jgi:predicted nucleotidyltransferase
VFAEVAVGQPVSASPEELRRMAAREVELRERRRETLRKRFGEARAEAERLAVVFRQIDPEMELIVLFGSLARGDATSADVDIDLAIRCSPDRFLRLVAESLNSSFRVDLVELDRVGEPFRRSIARDGVVLYEK